MDDQSIKQSWLGFFGAVWGAGGFVFILLDAINRLFAIAIKAFENELNFLHWGFLLLFSIIMAYSEGYRGFQKSFSPKCATRTLYLYRNPDVLNLVFAPFFVMGFFRASRRALIFAWAGTAMILMFVLILQVTPQPWRGIADIGVIIGLSWGIASFLFEVFRVFHVIKD
ncbi:MAG: hypothetical protein VYA80_06210 [Pseudomonadota bacterium]|nr:hypothetical protein [Pseudomonadota bacterium]